MGKIETKKHWGIIFWLVFACVVFILFLINRDAISRNLHEAGFLRTAAADQTNQPILIQPFLDGSELIQTVGPNYETSGTTAAETEPTNGTINNAESTGQSSTDVSLDAASGSPGLVSSGSSAPVSPLPNESSPETSAALSQTPALTSTPVLRERTLYFITVDKDGTIIRTKATRSIPASDSPLTDILGALIAGPDPEERRKGLISLIPEESRIMNVTVRGSTAYISFSEDFQYNTYGVEGYAGAVRQVVWTATEFSNVLDVQILIENRRLDFLGEGVWIGSPLTRAML